MKYPSRKTLAHYLRQIPRWVILLILMLLFGRFVIVAVFHLLS